ncbi:MAG: adenylyl-sulfate kinase [Hyphomicrobium sp.]|nr:adenylyl-sulfate kinase [Hyphomicrobium sp.]
MTTPLTLDSAAKNCVWEKPSISRQDRAILNGHRSCIVWFTGLSGSGKSTLARRVEEVLFRKGIRTFVLDGDNVRHGLCSDLGFDAGSRKENIRRVAEVAKMMMESGIVVLTAFISPFAEERRLARTLVNEGDFFEIYCKASLAECEARDVKGFYKKARLGQIKNYTGINSPYEIPDNPDLILDTELEAVDVSVARIVEFLDEMALVCAQARLSTALPWSAQ